ncbi:tripartite tricarboxylate transporter substrate binding protein [Verticiella sediminum]|uniref:Tripartite tricarboxylate transporter substrate binding protein n=2 Tax=Verticiella sediminum TaxID=1247510 RepID=A0A556AD09_9BURK|nr:tripartite tricarboxylate transporter substrate binding protein [Verticiella sediminum]
MVVATSLTHAQSFPAKPVRLVVPYPPGGTADIVARLVTDEWARQLGQAIVVENRSGAGGNIGVEAVIRSRADGYTIGLQTVSLAINPALYPKLNFEIPRDVTPIGMVAASQHVLVAHPDVGAADVPQLIELANKSPGTLTYASAGAGSTSHMAAELFKAQARVNILHIPYRGSAPGLVDNVSGVVDLSFPVLSTALGQIQTGNLRALAVTGASRSPLLPSVPTIQESGLAQYDFSTWTMVFAPADVPGDIVRILNESLNAALRSTEVQTRLLEQGFEASPSTPSAALERVESEVPVWAELVKNYNIKLD